MLLIVNVFELLDLRLSRNSSLGLAYYDHSRCFTASFSHSHIVERATHLFDLFALRISLLLQESCTLLDRCNLLFDAGLVGLGKIRCCCL